jgi:ankyrin repeat protein
VQVMMVNLDDCIALMMACSFGDVDAVEILLKHSPNEQVLFCRRRSAIMCARSARIVEMLLEHSPDAQVLLKDHMGRTALMWACLHNNPEIINLLLRHSPEMQRDMKDDQGHTAFDYANINEYKECAELLLML